MKNTLAMICAALALLLPAGCDIHEEPVVEAIITWDSDIYVEGNKVAEYPAKTTDTYTYTGQRLSSSDIQNILEDATGAYEFIGWFTEIRDGEQVKPGWTVPTGGTVEQYWDDDRERWVTLSVYRITLYAHWKNKGGGI